MISSSLCYIEKDGRYLMLHRVKKETDANKDKWIGVGGKFEEGESPEDCVRREVLEEVGLHVKNIRYYKNQPWSFTDTLLVGYYCDLDGEAEIHIDRNELCEGVWVERAELPVRENDVSLTAEMIEMFRIGEK